MPYVLPPDVLPSFCGQKPSHHQHLQHPSSWHSGMQSKRAKRLIAYAATNALEVEDATERAFTELAAAKYAVDWRTAGCLQGAHAEADAEAQANTEANANGDGDGAARRVQAGAGTVSVGLHSEEAQLLRSRAAAARAAAGGLMAVLPPDQPATLQAGTTAAAPKPPAPSPSPPPPPEQPVRPARAGRASRSKGAQQAAAAAAASRSKDAQQQAPAAASRSRGTRQTAAAPAAAAAKVRALQAAQPKAAHTVLRRCELALPGGAGTVLRVPSDRRGLLAGSAAPAAADAARAGTDASAPRRQAQVAAAQAMAATLEEAGVAEAAAVVQRLCAAPSALTKRTLRHPAPTRSLAALVQRPWTRPWRSCCAVRVPTAHMGRLQARLRPGVRLWTQTLLAQVQRSGGSCATQPPASRRCRCSVTAMHLCPTYMDPSRDA